MATHNDRTRRSRRLKVLSTTLTLVIAFVLLMLHQYVVGRRLMVEELQTTAAIIGANSAAALAFNDVKAARETLGAIRLTPRVIGGALYQADGMLLAREADAQRLLPSNLPVGNAAVTAPTGAPGLAPDGPVRGLMREEISVEGTRVGTLLLHVTFVSLYWHMLEYAIGTLAIAAVALLLAYQLTSRMRGRMLRAESQLEHMAFFDQVTGLPNRRLFEYELRQAVTRVQREHDEVALLFIDVDDFKKVNDSCGHEAGDQVLQLIGERLKLAARSSDVVARLGGDEFAALLFGIGSSDNAATVARSMIELINEAFPTQPVPSHVGLSIGVALLKTDGNDPALLLRRADMAMYVAKTSGKNNVHFFSEEIDARVRGELALEAGLRQALTDEGHGLWVAYQPQLCAQTRQLQGVEALVRWQQDDGRLVSPAEFIPVAEKSGLITDLGDWVLSQVCRDLALMRAEGVELPRVAVNVSSRQLLRGRSVVDHFCETLRHFGERVDRFEFELTESALTGSDGAAVLDAFVDAGFTLSIDDFGTGYSSLGYLKRFQVGTLKIDQSFVRGLPHNVENAAIVVAVIQMARALNIKVVAEGVEAEEQARFLQAAGCDVLQGYLLGRPMPPAQLVSYVKTLGGTAWLK
jgi:diguanylate cyclase (GGDEF)-like protein